VNFLLDTNAISALMREDPRLASWLSSVQPDNHVLTCTIARGEILFGLEKLSRGKRRSELDVKAQRLFAAVMCEPIPPAAADFYAAVKADQQRRGFSLDENDLLIAATALALGATLVSSDTDFERIGALAVVVP
jgi:tRNA(fMet)-specific endonuclease VapC